MWTLNTLHKRGAPRSGLNDEKELGHVVNVGTMPADVHARVGREKMRSYLLFRRPSVCLSVAKVERGKH